MADQLPTPFDDEDDEVSQVTVANPFMALSQANQQQGAGGQAVVATEAQAMQMHIMLARSHPRDQRQAVEDIRAAFARPTLAAKAEYQYTKGGTDIKGPSIRAAEAIAQQWGNIYWGFAELSRHADRSEIFCFAQDLQKGTLISRKFWMRHWIDTKGGGRPTRDEREINELMSNQAQRRVRQCILGVIPGDVVELAIDQGKDTLKRSVNLTPELIQKVIAQFGKRGVTKEQLEKRVQRHMDSIGPAQYLYLLRIFNSLKDGMSTPEEWFGPDESVIEGETTAPKGPAGNLERAKEALAKKQKQQQPEPPKEEEKKAEPPAAEREPGADDDAGEEAPPPQTAVEAMAKKHAADLKRIAGSKTEASLDVLWKVLSKEYGGAPPMDLEIARNDRREAIRQEM